MFETSLDHDLRDRLIAEAIRRGRRRRRLRRAAASATTVLLALLALFGISLAQGTTNKKVVTAAGPGFVPSTILETPSTAPASSAAVSSSTTSSDSVPIEPCTISQLALKTGGAGPGGAGQVGWADTLQNKSEATCSVTGYPTVTLMDAANLPIGISSVPVLSTGCSCALPYVAPGVINLQPQQAATFLLVYTDSPTGSQSTCPSASYVTVTLPGVPGSLSAVAPLTSVCSTINVQALTLNGVWFH